MLGFLAWAMCNAIAFYMTVSIMIPQRLKDIGVGNPDAVLGAINAAGAILSIFYAVFIGAFSDRTRSRFGRRTPWVIFGAVLYAVAFGIISLPSSGLTIGLAYCVGLIGLNAVQAPVLAMVSDRVPEGFRATASAALGGGGVAGQALGMLIASFFITRMSLGFVVASLFALASGWLSMALIPREPSATAMPREESGAKQVVLHALTPPTKGAGDFWKAFACRTCLIVAYQMITSYQLYILQDYVGLDKINAASAISVMAIITMIVSFVASFIAGPISDLLKRRKLPILVACVLYAIGIMMPWLIPNVMGMYLFAGIAGFGYGMYCAVDQALNVDVLPNKKDAGKDLGILNIATCAGQALGSFLTSMIVTVTDHNYNFVFPTAIIISAVAGLVVVTIKRIK
jgi:MFS family permease